jgi:HK97 family phage prohead protease
MMYEEYKPFPNEHAARLRNPRDFNPTTFRRTRGGTIFGSKKVPSTIGIIWGKLKGADEPSDNPIPQSLRFNKDNWTVDEAKKWLKDNNIKVILFEAASGKSKQGGILNMFKKNRKEYKSFLTEFKVNLEVNEFEGYASTFGNRDSGGDVVEKGAFKKTIKEFIDRMKVLWQHDYRTPIGKPITLKEDDHGLYVHAKVSETRQGKDALILMKDDVINELSIGYDAKKYRIDEETKTRHLTEVKLWEFSPVTWGMNELAVIVGAKSDSSIEALLFELNDYLIKEGRVLSGKNRKIIQDAISALQALLAATEPEKSTQGADGQSHKDDDEPTDEEKSLIEVSDMLKDFSASLEKTELLKELKEFGVSLKQ